MVYTSVPLCGTAWDKLAEVKKDGATSGARRRIDVGSKDMSGGLALFRLGGRLAEQAHVAEANGRRNAARHPVLDALNTALGRVKANLSSDLCGSAERHDQAFIGMVVFHGVIKHHV